MTTAIRMAAWILVAGVLAGCCFWGPGVAWAEEGKPFVWHQDEANPIFKPAETGWDSGSIRLDTAQTKWRGVYDDSTMHHVATPALYQIGGKWHLHVQTCGRAGNDNYIDGGWEMWGVACDRRIPTRPGCADLFIPGLPD